jgi:YfiR/HmsC-like
MRPRLHRPNLVASLISAAALSAAPSLADELAVPLQQQVEMSVKVIEYAQEPRVQEADVLRIGILVKTRGSESARAGIQLKAAFDRSPAIAGRPHEQSLIAWSAPAALVDEVRRRNLAIVYLTPGFDTEVAAIARAFHGLPVITIAAIDGYVRDGALLGFELVSGRPKMIFNLAQARKQEVVFRSAVMKLMRILE